MNKCTFFFLNLCFLVELQCAKELFGKLQEQGKVSLEISSLWCSAIDTVNVQ